ncbi:MAG: hypothetical protein HYY78_07285 [Betaproteobacteria bacterium]|nr:hypothetical protein [Betaproteobacteria bacterium]
MNDPEAARELQALGLRVLPVTVVDGRQPVVGYEVPALKKLLGIGAEVPRDLNAAELLEKYRLAYDAARRAVQQIPNDMLDWATPAKERRGQTLRQIAWHLFDRPDVCMDAAKTGHFTFEDIHQYERLANNYRTTRDIVEYGDDIMARLEDFLTNQPHLLDTVVQAYFGPRTVGQLLNMTLSGIVLRLKQTYHFMRSVGVEPKDTMREEDFAGIPVPKKLFG